MSDLAVWLKDQQRSRKLCKKEHLRKNFSKEDESFPWFHFFLETVELLPQQNSKKKIWKDFREKNAQIRADTKEPVDVLCNVQKASQIFSLMTHQVKEGITSRNA